MNMKQNALADKVLILGCDAFDPRMARHCVEQGLMPNLKKYIERGSARADLTMLGAHPTVTPPMWTTLATGCNANVHGITDFYRKGDTIDELQYNLDSRLCKAEQLWNVLAEAGKKTLVWHWQGSSWPPSSNSENLYVVDGTSPGGVNMSSAQVEKEYMAGASEMLDSVQYKTRALADASTACIITDLDLSEFGDAPFKFDDGANEQGMRKIFWKPSQIGKNFSDNVVDLSQSYIRPAEKWSTAPAEAKEFVILFSGGAVRRPALILKNESGIYDRVAIYKNKKETEPIVILEVGKMAVGVLDISIKNEHTYHVNRNLKLLKLDPEGKELSIYVSAAMDIENDIVWSPKRLFQDIVENVGYPPPTSSMGCQDSVMITDCMLDNWNVTADWQAAALHHLIGKEQFDVVFTHYHAIDLQGHMFIKHLSPYLKTNKNPVSVATKWLEDVYVQTDQYLGKFLHLLDEGWTILICSDHGMVSSTHDVPVLTDLNGVCAGVLADLGYTVLKRDENNEIIGEIDWEKTKAVMQREGDIYINLKGREPHGIVEPEDKYALEEEIMTALYGVRDPETGYRIVSVALRNKDAVLLGLGGPECGDILVWNNEGFNFDHGDSLSTTYGEGHTSVSPLFIAAGKGIKENFVTERIIRQADFTPTVAVLCGVRMPAQCEGAPVYQIFDDK